MSDYLDSRNFPCPSPAEERALARALDAILSSDFRENPLAALGTYRRVLGDNRQRAQWGAVFEKLKTLFMCGRSVPLDGPMIGVTLAIRDSDYFRETARLFGRERSAIANIEWMASCWNVTFGPTGLWMGKTFEPVERETFAALCGGNAEVVAAFDPAVCRIGRNFFRQPADPDFLQSLGLPVLSEAWQLRDRPFSADSAGFQGEIRAVNLAREVNIPYSKTGGIFLSMPGRSVVAEMNGRPVYHLNYRWPALNPAYPMTRLVDELVQIAEGIYLGQLVMATRHYSLGAVRSPLPDGASEVGEIGDPYHPAGGAFGGEPDYGYQNNGFFLMINPDLAKEAYADTAFPHLRPRPGESGYTELGYDLGPEIGREAPPIHAGHVGHVGHDDEGEVQDWAAGWSQVESVRRKFTTFCLETSPNPTDGDVRELLRDGESILQMLQRIQAEVSAATAGDDSLQRFEPFHRLFRAGIAPAIRDGVFQGQGSGYNTRFDAPEERQWYGQPEPCRGFDYYHGATLNLHCGLQDTLRRQPGDSLAEPLLLPNLLASRLQSDAGAPNLLDAVWASIGRFIFPWAGKSFERISGRKLSMLLDESADLEGRYPERVMELRQHAASWPHLALVEKNAARCWPDAGAFGAHLEGGPWDRGMSDDDKSFWRQEASDRWVYGNNLQDERILAADPLFRALDMNYGAPLPSIQQLADSGPSPFVRQGYSFLGVSDRESILPFNNGDHTRKRVFQFHYRYPLIGGAFPIGLCLDELVEIAEGLFLGQLIYATELAEPFHSTVDPARYRYQLFGYFLLLDNTWERHRQAIGFDVNRH